MADDPKAVMRHNSWPPIPQDMKKPPPPDREQRENERQHERGQEDYSKGSHNSPYGDWLSELPQDGRDAYIDGREEGSKSPPLPEDEPKRTPEEK